MRLWTVGLVAISGVLWDGEGTAIHSAVVESARLFTGHCALDVFAFTLDSPWMRHSPVCFNGRFVCWDPWSAAGLHRALWSSCGFGSRGLNTSWSICAKSL